MYLSVCWYDNFASHSMNHILRFKDKINTSNFVQHYFQQIGNDFPGCLPFLVSFFLSIYLFFTRYPAKLVYESLCFTYCFHFVSFRPTVVLSLLLWLFQLFLAFFVFSDRDFPNITITVDNRCISAKNYNDDSKDNARILRYNWLNEKNNGATRAARILWQDFDVVRQIATWNFKFKFLTTTWTHNSKCSILYICFNDPPTCHLEVYFVNTVDKSKNKWSQNMQAWTNVYFRVSFSSYFQIAHTSFHSKQKTGNTREIFAELRHEILSWRTYCRRSRPHCLMSILFSNFLSSFLVFIASPGSCFPLLLISFSSTISFLDFLRGCSASLKVWCWEFFSWHELIDQF